MCESGDTFAVERDLPPFAEGDLVALTDAGAYGAVMSSTYNTRPLVPEVIVSWFGLPGPGEPVLIAAATVAAKHKLDISPVVLAAGVGAVMGGILGWLAGMLAGRSLLTAPGPLRKMRQHAAERGEALFKRREALAVALAPSWVAGINRAGVVVFNTVNALSAAAWAVGRSVTEHWRGARLKLCCPVKMSHRTRCGWCRTFWSRTDRRRWRRFAERRLR